MAKAMEISTAFWDLCLEKVFTFVFFSFRTYMKARSPEVSCWEFPTYFLSDS